MRRLVAMAWVLTGLVALHGTARAQDKESAKAAAARQATAWVELVDAGAYADSWQQAAATFKESILESKWAEMAAKARQPLGKVVSRTVSKSEYTEQMPGAPDGKYVVVEYTTSFEQKKAGAETAITVLETDGAWRVVGYFIK